MPTIPGLRNRDRKAVGRDDTHDGPSFVTPGTKIVLMAADGRCVELAILDLKALGTEHRSRNPPQLGQLNIAGEASESFLLHTDRIE